jgi:predicted kinase
MSTLFLLCGLPGSGKTTIAKQLERERNALRLSPDEWMTSLAVDLYDESKRSLIEALQWRVAARMLTLGIDVVLEFGLWSRQERDDYRAKGAAVGATVKLIYLDVSRNELLGRIAERNANLASSTAHIEQPELDRWLTTFEPPQSEELM